MELSEFVVNYVKHKDIIKRELKGIDLKDNEIEFKFKNRTHVYRLKEDLDEEIFNVKVATITFVCINSEKNINFVVKNFGKLKHNKNLTLLFVNSITQNKWVLHPYTHSLIADPDSLEQGLRSMYEQAQSG